MGLRHLTKADKEKAIFRGLGSIDISASVRSIVQVGYHPNNGEQRVMVHENHNLSRRGASQMYSLVDNRRGNRPDLRWDGECDLTAADLGRPTAPPGRPVTASADARAFVTQFLLDGPKLKKKLEDAALKLGIKDTTLRRAINDLTQKEGKMLRLKPDPEPGDE